MAGTAEILRQMDGRAGKPNLASASALASPLDFSRRIPELDGLRGVAIAMVVFVHYIWFAIVARPPEPLGYIHTMARPLWSAVDLFFILSGFLIGGNLLDARDSPNYFSTFYVRRFCRVLPIYFLFFAIFGIGYRFLFQRVGAPLEWAFVGKLPWYSYLSFAQNIWMAKWKDSGAPVLAITWAFAVEVQFYFVVPAIIRFVRRSALPYVFAAAIATAPLVRLLIVYRFREHLWATYYLLPCRMDSLFLGLLCAYWVRQPRIWTWMVTHRTKIWAFLFALLAGTPALNHEGIPLTLLWVSVGYGWMAAIYATAMILVLADSQSFLGRVMRRGWLAGLGTISYGVYLFHMGIYCVFKWLLTDDRWLLASWRDFEVTLLAFAITLGIGKLSWRYFEKPIVRWSHVHSHY